MSTYQPLTPIERDEAIRIFASDDARAAGEAILRLALHDPDGEWVTDRALPLLEGSDPELRGMTATALGHVARIHGAVDPRVVPALQRLLRDPSTAGRADDALGDIAIFAPTGNE